MMTTGPSQRRRVPVSLLAGLVITLVTTLGSVPRNAWADSDPVLRLEAQRAAFRAVWPEAERGRWDRVAPHLPLLESYVLLPELRSAWLRATIQARDASELEDFLDAHEGHPVAREVMLRWLSVLAAREDWAGFDRVYRRMGGSRGARLQCLAATAGLALGPDAQWTEQALTLWRVGISQPSECDAVFGQLRRDGVLTSTHFLERMELALARRQFGLARYLARSLDEDARQRVRRWEAMQQDPAGALAGLPHDPADPDEWQRARYGLLVLASRESDIAFAHWRRLNPRYNATDGDEVGRRIALAGARRNTPQAAESLARLPATAVDQDVRLWQMRLAVRDQDWARTLRATTGTHVQTATALDFWRGRALEALGAHAQATSTFRRVAAERSLYGFMAAERVGQPKALHHQPTAVDLMMQRTLASRPEFIHARELFMVGLDSRGRSAWARATAGLDDHALTQAALLAHAWGWHSRAIATAARAGLMDDLEIRYPLAWHERFAAVADLSAIPSTWSIGVARNESLFIPDIASSAGAVGIMQLMPATGREVAADLRMSYRGLATLVDPDLNIRLGTRYLERMLGQFGHHYVLATAAYNAGPARVQRWLPEGDVAADAWIETIPFDETRDYVHRVLASQAIFHWRLTGDELALGEIMAPIPARPGG